MYIGTIFLIVIFSAACMFLAARRTIKLHKKTLVILTITSVPIYIGFLIARPDTWIVANGIVLIVSVIVGSSLGLLLTTKPSIISFCVAASIVDIFSVSGGITAKLSDAYQAGSSTLLRYLTISFPFKEKLQPIIGIGDLIVICALYFALMKLQYRGLKLAVSPLTGLLAAVTVGLIAGGISAIPFIAVATIGYLFFESTPGNN